MEFEWLMTAAPQTNVMKSRRPRLPASTKVNRICGNLTTSHRLKVRTLTEGCGRVQVAGGGRIGRCRCLVNRVGLTVSESLPLCPQTRTLLDVFGMSQRCQSTKSLRSSPLRGSKSREAG